MNFKEYQEKIEKFCVYPNIGEMGLAYPVLGLVGEVGETFHDGQVISPHELGDVYFYATRILTHAGEEISSSNSIQLPKQRILITESIQEIHRLSYGIAEDTKKLNRDKNMSKVLDIISKDKEILVHLFSVAKRIGYTPEQIMQMNYDKLNSRLERGVIRGDGDNR